MIKPVILLFALLISAQLFAQKIFVGPEIGLNLIQVEEQEIGRDYQPGLHAGGAFEYRFEKGFSLKSGIYFSQGQQQLVVNDTSAFDFFGMMDSTFAIPGIDMNTYKTTTSRQTQAYLQVPILANYKWKGLNVFAGGYVGFMLGASRKENAISTTPFMTIIDLEALDPTGFITAFLPQPYEETYTESTDKENLRVVDYGLKAGIGYDFDNVGMNVAYSFGLPDFREDYGELELQRHQYFQFSVYYLFGLNGKKGVSSVR